MMISFIFLLLATPVFAADWTFSTQPYEGVRIWVNGTEAKATLVSNDKEIGTFRMNVPNSSFRLKVSKSGFRNFEATASPAQTRFLAALDTENSRLRFLQRIPTGAQPKSATFLDETHVVLPLLADHGIDVASVVSNEIQRIAPPANLAARQGFVESAVIKNQGELWVSQMTTNSVHVFSLPGLLYQSTLPVPGQWGKVLLSDPDRRIVYFSKWMSKDIAIIDSQTHQITGSIPAGGVPRGLALSQDGKYLYVAQYGRDNGEDKLGRVVKVSLDSRSIIKTIGQEGAKRHMVLSRKRNRMYVSDMARNEISVIDLSTDEEVQTFKTFDKPNTIALNSDENHLYVSCRGPNNPDSYLKPGLVLGRVQGFDLDSGNLVEDVQSGNQPTGLAISPSGQWLVSTDFLDAAARVFEILR